MKRNLDIQKEWESIGAAFSTRIGLPLFSVPENYFETLTDNILSGIKATSAPDAALDRTASPYVVPSNYFEHLDSRISSAVKAADNIIAAAHIEGLSKDNVFTVPESYFDALPDKVLARINAEVATEDELAESPLLAGLKGRDPFEGTPQIEVEIPSFAAKRTAKEERQIEVPMTVRKSLRWSNWVAAASVAVFFVLGASWLHWDHRSENAAMANAAAPKTDEVSRRLAAISDEAIQAYVDQHIDEFNEYMLEANISAKSNNANIEKSLNNISDEALEAYMYDELY